MKFRVTHPAMFKRWGSLVVSTRDGLPFYVHDGEGTFTLPVGRYTLDSGEMLHTGYLSRPAPSDPVKYAVRAVRVAWSRKHGKAAINVGTGQIWLHPMFRKMPLPVRRFVLLHEVGHLYHDDEPGADDWAARTMWSEGYNPSQIAAAAALSLSGCISPARINLVQQFARHADT